MSYSDRVLLTVHGVMSDNAGLANLRDYCQKRLPGLICESFYYGNLIPARELTPAVRMLVFKSVNLYIRDVANRFLVGTNRKLYIVAHSFGTLATIRALQLWVPTQTEALVLLGSIVPRDFEWQSLVDFNLLTGPPLAVIRPLDNVVRFARRIDGAPSGAEGFIATGGIIPIQTYKDGGHTAYDPDDRDDVVETIDSGLASVSVQTRDQWYAKQNILKRGYIHFCNLFMR
jgi:hypothetical protein